MTDSDEFFPNEDFFPAISNLYNDMGDNTGNANKSSSTAAIWLPGAFASVFFEKLKQIENLSKNSEKNHART
jgi:hypothetical protein